MKRTITTVTSLAALVLAAPLAFAQDKAGGGKSDDRSPSQMENKAGGSDRGMEKSGGQRNENAGDRSRERAGNGAERGQGGQSRDQAREHGNNDAKDRKDARDESKDQRKDAKDNAREQRKDAADERKSGDDAKKSSDRNDRAGSDQDRDKSREKAEDRNKDRDKSREKAEDGNKDRDNSRDRADDNDRNRERNQDQAKDQNTNRDRDQAGDRKSDQARGEIREEDRQKAEQVRSKVDRQERDRLRERAFRGDVRRANNVDVRVDIGVRLPRRVEVYDLPSDIVDIVPAYRGYRYIVVGDDYCIVDPDTYVVVDVIHRGGGDRGQYAYRSGGGSRLDLTNDQIEIIRRAVHDRGRKFDYQGDLEVGIKLPGDFDFEPFPDTVVEEVPTIRNYRFVRVEDEIAIVAKDQPEVVFVFED